MLCPLTTVGFFNLAAFSIEISITCFSVLMVILVCLSGVPWSDSGHLLAVPSSAAFSDCKIKQIIQGGSDLLFWLSLCFCLCSMPLCSASKSSIVCAEPDRGIYTCKTYILYALHKQLYSTSLAKIALKEPPT